jgi:hypothetical protein
LTARPTPDAIWSAADAFSAPTRHCLLWSLAKQAENPKGGLALKALQIASARASDDARFVVSYIIASSNLIKSRFK